ncbi:flap endonuclease Xni [Shewanella litorisediminis]|uniref:Flap endonuclease Xni n=1 Tax=Shewanella litorisediminis TaxID=1173586 RepID=A0ABX7G0B0_9GAMM|nr:flap endonuclease Xni [Shewanella litorisediminis]MCL2918241.1 flap endonuclease Xni [Shewanella litorisediminis]QRH00708.1 flap endonuclease Xni [Shewanella litorisediminis]
MNRLLIIDGLNLIRRIHAALPDEGDMDTLYERVAQACRKLLRGHQPTHCAIVWDGDAVSWRKHLYQDYKKGRKPMPEALAKGLPALKIKLEELDVHSVNADSEADDVIATLACKLAASGGEAIIVSTDKGLLQLMSPHIRQWDHFAGQFFDIEAFESKLGIERHQLLDYIALCGDSGNKIPGIPGIGPKSASELLRTYRSLANLYHSLGTLGSRQANKLREGRDMARLSYKLAKLQTDLPLHLKLSALRVVPA